jgi:hypothetical protein
LNDELKIVVGIKNYELQKKLPQSRNRAAF